MRMLGIALLAALLAAPAYANLTAEKKIELIRDLTAEMGTVQVVLPRSKNLDILPDGTYDTAKWGEDMTEHGVAARVGDMVQITGVSFTNKRLVMVINHGLKGGRKWYHRIQVSGSSGTRRQDVGGTQTNAPGGTQIALFFKEGVPDKTTEEFKAILKNVLDFEIRSATEQYLDQIEPEFREAIEEEEVITGMDKEMVLLVMDRPDRKYRDFKNGVETEDWIYGTPPGDIVFVTFQDGKVINVKYEHASLGGEVRQTQPIDR